MTTCGDTGNDKVGFMIIPGLSVQVVFVVTLNRMVCESYAIQPIDVWIANYLQRPSFLKRNDNDPLSVTCFVQTIIKVYETKQTKENKNAGW